MKKAELLALGLPEENLKEFQRLYHRDLTKALAHKVEASGSDAVRQAIMTTLPTIEAPDRLRAILATVTHHYLEEYREQKNKKTAADAANIDGGKVEQKSDELQCSTPIVTEE